MDTKDLVVIGLAAALVFGGYGIGYNVAKDAAHEEEIQKLEAATAEIESLNKQLFAAQEKFDGKVSNLRAQFAKDKAVADADHDRVVAALRDGSKRLRVRVASCDQAPATATPSASSRVDGDRTAELPAETGVALYQLADDANAVVRKLTALQEWSHSAVQFCNGEPK